MHTGEKIRLARKKKNLTQEAMADALNISQRAYSKIENDEVSLKIDRLEQIANFLEVESKELLPGVPTQNFEQVSYSQIGNGHFINNVNDKERELFDKVIDRQQEEINYLKGIIDSLKK